MSLVVIQNVVKSLRKNKLFKVRIFDYKKEAKIVCLLFEFIVRLSDHSQNVTYIGNVLNQCYFALKFNNRPNRNRF